jgi:hypothetical protein
MQIKTIPRFYLTPARLAIIKKMSKKNAGQDAGKKEP